jgi:hypothetical protein
LKLNQKESCEFESRSWRGALDTALKFVSDLQYIVGQWFLLGTPASSANKTAHHDLTETLLKVALNTIALITPTQKERLKIILQMGQGF